MSVKHFQSELSNIHSYTAKTKQNKEIIITRENILNNYNSILILNIYLIVIIIISFLILLKLDTNLLISI